MVKKWFNVKNMVAAIKTSVSIVAKQLGGAISLLNTMLFL